MLTLNNIDRDQRSLGRPQAASFNAIHRSVLKRLQIYSFTASWTLVSMKMICSLFQYSNSDVIQKPLILLCQTEATHKANTKSSVAIHKNCHSLYTLSYYKFVCLFVCFFTIKVLHAANLLLLMVQQSSIHCSKINTTVEAWYCLVAKKVSILSGCL